MILLCTSIGSHQAVVLHDVLLASALRVRGEQVEALLCDGALPACEACTYESLKPVQILQEGPQDAFCTGCYGYGSSQFKKRGIRIHRYTEYLTPGDDQSAQAVVDTLQDEELRTFSVDGINVGEEAYAGALRYYAVGDLRSEPAAFAIFRRYLKAAILSKDAVVRLFTALRPTVAVFHHGIYVPQGIVGQVARSMGIRVVNWALGYRKKTFIYSHDDTYHRTMINEPVDLWRDRKLSEEQQRRLMEYLQTRRTGSRDWIKFNEEPEENAQFLRAELRLDNRPIILLLTNVTWDAQLFYKTNAFPSLLDWLEHTIRYFGTRSDLQLIIRVHPGEIRGTLRSRQPVMEVMNERIPIMPANIRVVQAESSFSTYALAEMADTTIIFGTKTGVELVPFGTTVVVVGEAWVRGKGLTIDIDTRRDYDSLLERLPLRNTLSSERIELAKQYAFHYFFRRLIPIKLVHHVEQSHSFFERTVKRLLHKLLPSGVLFASPFSIDFEGMTPERLKADHGLEVICDGIVRGKEFVFDDVQLPL